METQTWYLELTEEKGSHKFYEVTLENADLTIRYGRIGDNGQTQKKTLETPEKALREAEKKLKEKRKGGYRDAVLGQTEKITAPRATKIPKLQIVGFTEVFEPITEPITKFGGQPVWLEEPRWSISPTTGKKISFLCQIKLEPEIFGHIIAKMAYLFRDEDDLHTDIVLQPGNITYHTGSFVTDLDGPTLTKTIALSEAPFYEMVESEWAVTTKFGEDPRFIPHENRAEWSEEKSNVLWEQLIGHKIGGNPNSFDEEFVPEDFS